MPEGASGGPGGPLVLFAVADLPRAERVVARMLHEQGYRMQHVYDVRAARMALRIQEFFALFLDTTLPGGDPWKLLASVRTGSNMPILMVSPIYVQDDATRAYREGADDYLTPVTPSEQALARITARLRRGHPVGGGVRPCPDAGLHLDEAARTAVADGTPLTLTPLEFDLLAAFVAHPRQVLTKEQLLRMVWRGKGEGDTQRVKYAVRRLRHRITEATGGRTRIVTVRGVGYRYQPPV